MSDSKRPGGESKAWVDADRTAPQNAFDKDDGYSGQQYSREAEAAQGRADRVNDVPRERSEPGVTAPAEPGNFSAP